MKKLLYLAMVAVMSVGMMSCDRNGEPTAPSNNLTKDYEFVTKMYDIPESAMDNYLSNLGFTYFDDEDVMKMYCQKDEEGNIAHECWVAYEMGSAHPSHVEYYRNDQTKEDMLKYTKNAYDFFGERYRFGNYTLYSQKHYSDVEKVNFTRDYFSFRNDWSTLDAAPGEPKIAVIFSNQKGKPNLCYTALYIYFSLDPTMPKYFSVSEYQKVVFAPGNLQYLALYKIWRFAPHQYDIIGKDNEQIGPDNYEWIDLFGWGTGANPTMSSEFLNDYKAFALATTGSCTWRNEYDFFNYPVHNGPNTDPAHSWTYLDSQQWEYLLHRRANAAQLKMLATVNGVSGLILLPDIWQLPIGVKLTTQNDMKWTTDGRRRYQGQDGVNYCAQNVLSAAQWQNMEANGAVFLPMAGYREGKTYSSSAGYYMDKLANFSQGGTHGGIGFDKNAIYPESYKLIFSGVAIRGVKFLK